MRDSELIENERRFKQLILFDGMNIPEWRNVRPTDLDGAIDLGGQASVMFEVKGNGKPLPMAQRVLLERWANKLKECVAFVCYHASSGDYIYLKECLVDSYYYEGKWHKDNGKRTARKALDDYLEHLKKKNINP